MTDTRGRHTRINFFKLLFVLWPGDIKQQLRVLNARIARDNNARRAHHVKLVLLREFLVFLGILLVARIDGKKGCDLWQGATGEGEGYHSRTDISGHMSSYRHNQIRRYFAFMFADESVEDTNPWWQIEGGIRAFNDNRSAMVRSHPYKTLDEIMSALRPRTTPKGKPSCLLIIQINTSSHLSHHHGSYR